MSNQKLKNQIIDWLQEQPYWLQSIGHSLLEGAEITGDFTAAAYELFKEDEGLKTKKGSRPAIVFNKKVADSDDADLTLRLQAVKNANNVNALAAGQGIKIGPNLTVIYGNNGSGKSGYVRLLNNAFPSRGDKEILPNVFAAAPGGRPECQFTFKRTEEPYDLAYPGDCEKYEFAQYAVFDTKSVHQHLGGENQLSFTPSGFDFFEKLMNLQAAIRESLDREIATKSAAHDFGDVFENDNDVRRFIENIGPETTAEELDELCTIAEKDSEDLEALKARLADLKAAEKSKRLKELETARNGLDEFCHSITKGLEAFRDEQILRYRKAIDAVKHFEELAQAEGLQNLEQYNISHVGSPAWREFVRAGQAYASRIEQDRKNQAYPSKMDRCLFCRQLLGDGQRELIRAYWDLLKSQAESELTRARAELAAIGRELASLPTVVFDSSNTVFETVKEFDPKLAVKWEEITKLYAKTRGSAIEAVDELDTEKLPPAIEASATELDDCGSKLDSDKAALIESNPNEEIAQLQLKIDLYGDRILLGKIRNKVEAYIEARKWGATARAKAAALVTTKITRLQGSLYREHVTEEYVAVFNEECSHLSAPRFVQLSQRNTRGNTLRKLKIAEHGAIKILSEGEQRAIALADFITEARLNPHNRGLILDDPVSSQDHKRREQIARRLVELAKSRQVVLFTHDIVFFFQLLALAESEQVLIEQNYVRNNGGTAGLVQSDLPWVAKPLKARIGVL